jgi:dihydrofolate reductase
VIKGAAMRKIIMFNRVSLDGFFAGPNGEMDWFVQDPAVDKAVHEMMRLDSVLFGRVTYQIFESFWPKAATDPNVPEGVRVMANELNQMTKVVFSKTLKEVTWQNSKLFKGDLIKEVRELKQGKGADMVIFGSGSIVQQLANAGLMDEYVFAVTPVVLGAGKALFKDVKHMNLNLLEKRDFKSGNVLLHYEADKSQG